MQIQLKAQQKKRHETDLHGEIPNSNQDTCISNFVFLDEE